MFWVAVSENSACRISCFELIETVIGGNSLTPVLGNELSAPALGMKVEVWDEEGHNIDASGEKGELVIVTPFPSMPLTFWGEGGVEKYRQAYFDVYPGIWTQGDLLSRDVKTKGYFIHGRSDGVLNPGGEDHCSALWWNDY